MNVYLIWVGANGRTFVEVCDRKYYKWAGESLRILRAILGL